MQARHKQWLSWAGVIGLYLGIQFAAGPELSSGAPPPLSGQTVQGAAFDLAQWRGRPAVIYFWGEWCPICRSMQSSIRAIAQGHQLISVAMQSGSAADVARYQQQQDFNVPTLADPDGAIATRYGLRGVPVLFVLDAEGRIRYATSGYTTQAGILARLWLAE